MPNYDKTPYGLKAKTKEGETYIAYFSYDKIVSFYNSNKIEKFTDVIVGKYTPNTSKFVKLKDLPEFYDLFSPELVKPSSAKVEPTKTKTKNTKTQTCPFCFEEVKLGAKKCKHCGETLDATLRVAEEAKRAADRQAVNVNTNVNTNVQPAQAAYLRDFPHLWHLLITLCCLGYWLPVWILHYIFRDKTYYR